MNHKQVQRWMTSALGVGTMICATAAIVSSFNSNMKPYQPFWMALSTAAITTSFLPFAAKKIGEELAAAMLQEEEEERLSQNLTETPENLLDPFAGMQHQCGNCAYRNENPQYDKLGKPFLPCAVNPSGYLKPGCLDFEQKASTYRFIQVRGAGKVSGIYLYKEGSLLGIGMHQIYSHDRVVSLLKKKLNLSTMHGLIGKSFESYSNDSEDALSEFLSR